MVEEDEEEEEEETPGFKICIEGWLMMMLHFISQSRKQNKNVSYVYSSKFVVLFDF